MFGHQDEPKEESKDKHEDAGVAAFAPPVSPAITTPLKTDDSDHTATSADLPVPAPAATPIPAHDTPDQADDLLHIKQQALQQLTPLVNHLDQSPEEKFRTTMMMIQAADNQGLIKTAYEAALAIKDEKARAQALLDIVNEINYFTTQQHSS